MYKVMSFMLIVIFVAFIGTSSVLSQPPQPYPQVDGIIIYNVTAESAKFIIAIDSKGEQDISKLTTSLEFGESKKYNSSYQIELNPPEKNNKIFSEPVFVGTLKPGTQYHFRIRIAYQGITQFTYDDSFSTQAGSVSAKAKFI